MCILIAVSTCQKNDLQSSVFPDLSLRRETTVNHKHWTTTNSQFKCLSKGLCIFITGSTCQKNDLQIQCFCPVLAIYYLPRRLVRWEAILLMISYRPLMILHQLNSVSIQWFVWTVMTLLKKALLID